MESGSDITLGDFWGVENYFPDLVMQEGLSIIICKTPRAHALLESVRGSLSVLRPAEYKWAAAHNEGLRFDPRKTLIGTPFSGSWPNAVPIRRRSI